MLQMLRNPWVAYAGCVATTYAAAAFVLGAAALYRGEHPDSLHPVLTVCTLIVAFGSPIMAAFGTFGLQHEHLGKRPLSRIAIWSVAAAWMMAFCLFMYCFGTLEIKSAR